MQKSSFYPMVFTPVYKDYIWGGDRIIRRYDRSEPPGVYAESWEISDRPADMSLVANGSLAGQSLHDLVHAYGVELLGAGCEPGRFPLLVKILDARENLSVQVHPHEESALKHGGEPKAEAWYILEAEPGAQVFAGVKPGVTEQQFRRALQDGTVLSLLNSVPVAAGDVVTIPGGRVHAIGAGCLLLEIQQNSDTTYRIYDWDRVGADGKPRELHVEQAFKHIRWQDEGPFSLAPLKNMVPGSFHERVIWPYFQLEQALIRGTQICAMEGQGFHVLFIEEGIVGVKSNGAMVIAPSGVTILIPAAVDFYEISEQAGQAQVLRIRLPI